MLKTLVYTFKKTFSSPQYYFKIINLKWQFSLLFFSLMMLILGLSSAWIFNQQQLVTTEKIIEQTIDEIKTNYPPDLVLQWQNQEFKILKKAGNNTAAQNSLEAYPQPVLVPWPQSLKALNNLQLSQYLAVLINDANVENLDQAQKNYNSLMIISPKKIYLNNQGNWQDFSLNNILTDEFEFNKDNLVKSLENWQSTDQPKIISQIKSYSYLVIPIVLIISRLWIAIFNALFIYLLFKIFKISYSKISVKKEKNKKLKLKISKAKFYTWPQIIQMCLHIVVVAETVNLLSKSIYQSLTLPMFSISFWAVVTVMVVGYRRGG